MALLDKLDDLRGKATEMIQSGVAIAKLKTDNMADEDAMRRAYLAIGKMYFELHSPQNVTVSMPVNCGLQKIICVWHK